MATPSRPALELLTQYARYHRDQRNIQTHFVGVPMIVFALGILLSWPEMALGGAIVLTPAWLLFGALAAWYLTRGQLGLGLAVTLMVGGLILLAHRVPAASTVAWLSWGVGFLVVGWLLQFAGHYYEGRKPALADDLVGLLVGPMFVALELLAALGLLRSLAAEVERRAGPTHLRDLAHPAT